MGATYSNFDYYEKVYLELSQKSGSEIVGVVQDETQTPMKREVALQLVGGIDLPDAQKYQIIVSMLNVAAKSVVLMALRQLSVLRDMRAVQAIREKMRKSDCTADVRGECLIALAKLGDQSLLVDCRAILNRGQSEERFWAIIALFELGTEKAAETLASHYKQETERENRITVALFIARHCVDLGGDLLLAELTETNNPDVKLMYAAALANLSSRRGAHVLHDLVSTWKEEELFKITHIINRFTDCPLEAGEDIRCQVLRWAESKLL
jgi:HEAT repeat protein